MLHSRYVSVRGLRLFSRPSALQLLSPTDSTCWPLVHVHYLFINLCLYFVKARCLSLDVLDLDTSTELTRLCVMHLIVPMPWAQCQGLRELLLGAAHTHTHAYTLTHSNFTWVKIASGEVRIGSGSLRNLIEGESWRMTRRAEQEDVLGQRRTAS